MVYTILPDCNQQPSRGDAAASSNHYKLEIKIAV